MEEKKNIVKILKDKGFLDHQVFIKEMIEPNEKNKKLYYKARSILNNFEELPQWLYEPSYNGDELYKKLSKEDNEILDKATEMYRYWIFRQCLKHDEMFPDERLLNTPTA